MDWPKQTPFPTLWKQLNSDYYSHFYVEDAQRSIENFRNFYLEQGWGFEPADVVEILLNFALRKGDTRIFCISENLTKALMNTNFEKIPTELIKLPFARIYIDFSHCDIEASYRGKISSYRGALLEITSKDSTQMLHMYHIRHLPGNLSFQKKEFPFAFSLAQFELSTEYFEMPNQKIMNELVENLREHAQENLETGYYTETKEYDDNLKLSSQEAIKLTISALLYINSVNADIREEWANKKTFLKWKQASGKHKTRLKQELSKQGKVFRVGHYIYIPTLPSDQGEKTDRKLKSRFIVRGHWHFYWVGSEKLNNKSRVYKWVEPYWKGPEIADLVKEKMYVVDQPKL